MMPVNRGVRTQPHHFIHKPKPGLENIFGDNRGAFRDGRNANSHGLQIRGKAGERKRLVVHCLGPVRHVHPEAVFVGGNLGAGKLQHLQWKVQVSRRDPAHGDIAPGHGSSIGPGAGNDSVADNLMLRWIQLVHPINHNGG